MHPSMYPVFADKERTHWWFAGRIQIFASVVRGYLAGSANEIVDIGCGTGGMLPLLRKFGTVYGLDRDASAVRYARERGYAEVVQADARALPYADGRFDLTVAADLIEHLEDPAPFVSELSRVTKPGGLILVTTAAFPILWSQLDELNRHYRRYTKRTLARDLSHPDLKLVRMRYYNVLLFFPILLLRFVERIFSRSGTTAEGLRELQVPPGPVNAALRTLIASERFLLPVPFPCGVSLLAVLRKRR